MKTFKTYYQHQLSLLRELSKEFSKAHPAIAPLLSAQSSDPDVERLLEGVAFLAGLLRQKVDDNFPKIIHSLTDTIFPHYLRPIPAMSVVVFSPKIGLNEPLKVPAGISLESIPVEDVKCRFKTCFDIEVQPIKVVSVKYEPLARQKGKFSILFELIGTTLSKWNPTSLTLMLGGSYSVGADLFMLLTNYLDEIKLSPIDEGGSCLLDTDCLDPIGFNEKYQLYPMPKQSFTGFRLIQEYFIFPYKFLFININGWEKWQSRGDGNQFEIEFSLSSFPINFPEVKADYIIHSATPVVNLFKHEADPIICDHKQEKIRINPSIDKSKQFRIFSVDKVSGFKSGSVEKYEYPQLTRFSTKDINQTYYQTTYGLSPVDNKPEMFLEFSYPQKADIPEEETLVVNLTCTNGAITQKLQLGDICKQTSDSPELLNFHNIIPPTPPIEPPIKGDILWRLISHLSFNLLSVTDIEDFKEFLRLYLFFETVDKATSTANLLKIDGINDFSVKPSDRLVKGLIFRGHNIHIKANSNNYASFGDLYVFGSVINKYFSEYSSINTYTKLTFEESNFGEKITWPVKLGQEKLF